MIRVCQGCSHKPHAGQCNGRNGQTAHRCPCLHDGFPVDAPDWCVTCDGVPGVVHVRDDGHTCANPKSKAPR